MRLSISILLLLLAFSNLFGQKQVFKDINAVRNSVSATEASPFRISTAAQTFSNSFIVNSTALQFEANKSILQQIEANKPAFLNLTIPVSTKSNIILELIPNNIFGDNYKVLNSQNQEISVKRGVYYKGIIKGDPQSLVSISIADGEISGIIASNKGNFILGKLQNSTAYIFYNDKELIEKSSFKCDVNDEGLKKKINSEVQNSVAAANVACRAVQVYFEADKAVYTAQGSNMTTATNFVNALFGQVAVLYDNEGIDVLISQLKIWNTNDPYLSATTTTALIAAFDAQIGSTFTGDIAHLISGRSVGGGIAGGGLCAKGTSVSSGITSTVVNVPTFSWNVYVVTHEMGHNFGSPHTQSCSWPGGPIDNCVPVEDGSCSAGPTPTSGGTIMSYCHLTSVGINFNNGFGTLPGNLIRNNTQTCMGNAVTPTSLLVLETYSTSVLLRWNSFAGPYTLEYKLTSASTWTTSTITTNVIQLTGLTANTAYNWRVKTNCSGYATSTFTTNSTPPLVYCNATYSTGCADFSIGLDDVIIGGINYNPNSGCSYSGGYSLIYSPIRNLQPGQNYSITLNPLPSNNAIQAAIWIDYNKNGVFEAAEKVFTTTAGFTSSIIGSFTVPAGSPTQTSTRMRVVSNFTSAPTNPCGSYGYGETEDFLVSIGNTCPSTLTLISTADDITSGNIIKQASATVSIPSPNANIMATNKITGTGTKATYQAKSLLLKPGFKAESGTVFKAEIGGCN